MVRRALAPLAAAVRWEHGRAPAAVRTVARHPGTVAVLAGSLVVAGASAHLVRYPDRVEPEVVAPPPVREVGPPVGADIAAYAEARHELLAAQPDDRELRAIVSFTELAPVDDLPLGASLPVERLHLLLPGEVEPREIPAADARRTLGELFARGRDELDREIADLEELLSDDLGDPAFEAEFTEQLESLRELREGVSRDAPVVFAAVVVATAGQLQELATSPPVRLVDPAGPPERTRGTRFVGVPPRDADAPASDRASTEREAAPSAAT